MAMALRGVRVAGPRIGRSVLATNVSFNEREVQQGEALIDEHFHPRIHPDDNVNDCIRKMAKLYVQQNGPQLMEFIRQNDFLHRLEHDNEEQPELILTGENEPEISVEETEEAAGWNIKRVLQWFWGKITGTEEQEVNEEINIHSEEHEEHTTPSDFSHSPLFLQSTISFAILITFAVVLSRQFAR